MAFRNLLIKELRSILPVYVIFAMAVFLLHLVVLFKRDVIDNDVILVLGFFMPFIFVAAIAIGTGYYQLHVEWKTNSIYLLLSLPIRGWKVLIAKLTAVIALLVITSIWIAASFAFILLRAKWDEYSDGEELTTLLPTMLKLAVISLCMFVLVVMFLIVMIHFTFLCGQLVTKFKWLVMICAFFGGLWLVLRISPLISSLLLWTPGILVGGDTDAEYLYSGPFIVLLLLSIGLISLNGYIFEKEVEV